MMPVAGAPGIFQATVNNVCPASFSYNFLNGDSSLTASIENFPDVSSRSCVLSDGLGGFNRTFTRTSGSPVSLGFKFNMCQSICGTFATATPASQTTLCQGASVAINANTGTGFTYQWRNANGVIPGATSSSYSASSSGSYRAIVSNVIGCIDTSAAVNVIVNSLPTVSAVANGPTSFCEGKSVIIHANSGSGLSYQWRNANGNISNEISPSYTAKSSGNYKVVITNSNGCSDTSAAIIVSVNPLPNASITAIGNTTFCQGKSVTLSANIGAGLIYQWNDSTTGNIPNATTANFIATAAGVYKVLITNNNGCIDSSETIKVTINPLPIATASAAGPTSFCEGNNVLITANSGTNLNYQWLKETGVIAGSTAASYLANTTGAYKVAVTNLFGCSDTSGIVQVNVTPNPNAGPMLGDSTNLKTSTPYNYTIAQQLNHTYNWQINNGIVTAGQGTNVATVQWINNGTGYVKVEVSNPQGCKDTATLATKIGNVGMNENIRYNSINIYPNPASNQITIDLPFYAVPVKGYFLRVVNLLGQVIHEEKINGQISTIDATAFNNGVHILNIYDDNGKLISVNKISIQKH